MGLEKVLQKVLSPIVEVLQDKIYWNNEVEATQFEYKSRDGFSAYPDNCGGLQICEVIPECESYEFDFLSFGEADSSNIIGYEAMSEEEKDEAMSNYNCDGELDAILRIRLKFEGFDAKGNMIFYFFAEGGNIDAPYFREGRQSTLFQAEFRALTLKDIPVKAKRHVNKLLKLLKGRK